MTPAHMSEAGRLCLTEEFEGLRLKAYLDTGNVWTIGWGHTAGVQKGDTCTRAQAEAWLREDIQTAEDDVKLYVTAPLTQGQFDALTDFAFNVGAKQFRTSTLVRILNARQYAEAAEQFKRWKFDNGVEIPGLVRRRKAERDWFLGLR